MTKLENIINAFRDRITSGEFKQGERIPSEYDLAEMYNINKSTANKAVAALVAEGYLRRGKRGSGTYVERISVFPSGAIAMIGDINHSYYAKIAKGVVSAAENANYMLAFFSPDGKRVDETISRIKSSNIQGIITFAYGLLDPVPDDIPVVYVDKPFPREDMHNRVNCNEYQGGRLQAEVLLKHKHRNIVYYTPEHNNPRNDGFRDTLRDNDITDADDRIFYTSRTMPHCINSLRKIFRTFPGVSAIACYSDNDALRLIKASKQFGNNLLENISLVGFGNVREINEIYNLTTIEQHPHELGSEAFHYLLEIIKEKHRTTHLNVEIEVELIPGETVSYLS